MGMFVAIFVIMLLCGVCAAGPTSGSPHTGTCWAMGDPHYRTFDGHYYNFMGNCTYTMAKNCHVDDKHPAFEVEAKNVNGRSSHVTAVGMVTVKLYGTTVDLLRYEYGLVRVNYTLWNLPIVLNNEGVKLSQSGLSVVMETDFGLTVQYDWEQYLVITVPGTFAGKVCGLCGNFNSDGKDDLITPSGSLATNVVALGKSWKVPGIAEDSYCRDECTGHCETCGSSNIQQMEQGILCKFLLEVIDRYFKGCQVLIDPKTLQKNCLFDFCRGVSMKTYLCEYLQVYADACQRAGIKVKNWRAFSQCQPTCPENSHFESCGSACPATCLDPDAPAKCQASCVEACTCDEGFLRSGNKCIPKTHCGCLHDGRYLEAGASFWADDSCTEVVKCSTDGVLSQQASSCSIGKQCRVVGGIRGCYSLTYATCGVSGDPHFTTFDGRRYNFQGTCAYEMAGSSSGQSGLEPFSVEVENSGRDKRTGSVIQSIAVKVYGYTIVISKDNSGFVLVNNEQFHLPMILGGGRVQLYKSGWFAVIRTDFGLSVSYNWGSIAFITVPSTYMGAMRGLCGNYNLDPEDDLRTKDGKLVGNGEEFGQGWKIATIPGCVNGCAGPCPACTYSQKEHYATKQYCGLIADPSGPFHDCHSKVDPAGFLEDCVYDVCLYQGKGSMQCKTLTAYTAICQQKGAKIYPWRSARFCDAQCPINAHYELCASDCPGTCQNLLIPSSCGPQCKEGCVCNEGYVLSGGECVPSGQCGCLYKGMYYKHGQVFYPDGLCQQECTCDGEVTCKPFTCGAYEKCEVKDGVRSCRPYGKGVCSISGDPHYNTFDNATFDFQGTCTYTVAAGCHLEGTRLKPFTVAVENERWYGAPSSPDVSVAKLVAVEAYGAVLILRRNQIGMVMVNGVLSHLPLSLHDGALEVYRDGTNDVIQTDFGLRVTYDLVYHVTVTVPGNYRGRTCGLCGNFNGDVSDDFRLPDESAAKDAAAFGAAWRVSVPGVVCEDGCSGASCPRCDDSKRAALEKHCAVISDPAGPFAVCHAVIDPASYYRDCVYDLCMAEGDQRMFCHSIAAYMLDCQDFGVKVQNWRSPTFCPLKCSANSHYEICAKACGTPCPGLTDIITCPSTCSEGCTCNDGYNFNGTDCVPPEQCSCYSKGHTYKVGQSIISEDCHKVTTCQKSGVILSQPITCKSDETCRVKNNARGCFLKQCSVTANGTFTPITGEAGTIANPGAYEIIKVCEEQQTSEWFKVDVKLEMCGNPGRNMLVAVYVFLNDLMITVNSKHEFWVNGRSVTQDSFSQNGISVKVSNNMLTINGKNLQLSLSPLNELKVTVSDKISSQVCGACGTHLQSGYTVLTLGDKLQMSLRGETTTLAKLNMGKWRAPDFPQCPV